MTRVALRGIRSHLGRFMLSILAVLLGVAFVAGTYSLRAMMASTFNDIVEAGTDGDAYVRGAQIGDSAAEMGGSTYEALPLDLADEIRAVDGVTGVVPDVEGSIVLVGKDGTAVMSTGPPSFGLGLHPDEESGSIVNGRMPEGPGEIVLETSALERSKLAVGDTTTVVITGELRQVEVVGEIGFEASMAGAIMVGLDMDTAIQAYAPDHTTELFTVYGNDGISQSALAASVSDVLATGSSAAQVDVLTGDAMQKANSDQWESALGFISTFLLIFAAIALFVGTFIISNTFQMVVRQRQREFAMLRAVGASPSQVFASVLGQAAAVGVIGSVLGVGAGLGLVTLLRQMFAGMGMEMSGDVPIDGFTVAISMITGTVVSLVAALVPARRAALTAPVEAMRDEIVTKDRSSRVRAGVGALLLAGGIASVATAAVNVPGNAGSLLGLGAVAILVAMLMLAPMMVPSALSVLAAPFVRTMRPLGGLARGNVARHPKRTASTAGALMIGMALVGAASVLAASMQASVRDVVDNQSKTDLILQSASWDVPGQLVADLPAVDGVGRVDALKVAETTTVDGEGTAVLGVPTGFFTETLEVPVDSGDAADLAPGQAVVQLTDAEANGWALGDTLTVKGGAGEVDVTIAAVIDSGILGMPVVLEASDYDAAVSPQESVTDTVFVDAAAGADVATVRADIAGLAKPYVVVSVMDGKEFGDAMADQVNQMLVILYALLGLSIVIAVLGIVNTLALSISERTREIGLLRAVGLGRLQLATTVTIESVLTAVFGTVLGIGVGAGLAAVMPTVFADQGLSVLVIPWSALATLLGLAVVVGAVAAVWPAVRAARMDVLEAIAYE